MKRMSSRDLTLYLLVILLMVFAVTSLQQMNRTEAPTYSQIRSYFLQEQVQSFTLKDNTLRLTLRGEGDQTTTVTYEMSDQALTYFYMDMRELIDDQLAAGILERGVDGIVVLPEALADLKAIVAQCKISQGREELQKAVITRVEPVGLGHRVCADTLSLLKRGQGMLVGNSSAFTFLVHAETEHNEYVAARPFRVNAGAVHAYVRLPHDKTCYLGELAAGQEVLTVGADGQTSVTTVGRVKIEVRPMLLVEAEAETPEGPKRGAVFLQNAETIRLTAPDGTPLSVVSLKPGDTVLCRLDQAGRHFGMRIQEEIREV